MDLPVDREELLIELTRLALDDDEAALYLAVLDLAPCGVREAAEEADVNRTSAYRILEDLAERGLVGKSSDQPMELTPLNPEPFFEALRREKARELDLISDVEAGVIDSLEERLEEARPEEPAGATWRVIRGRERLEEETATAIRKAETEVCLLWGDPTNWENPSGTQTDPVAAIQEKAKDLDVRALLDPSCTKTRRCRELSNREDVELRTVKDGLCSDTYLVDTEVFAGLVDPDEQEAPVVLWTDSPGLYENQRRMFEGLWTSAAGWS